MKKKYFKELLVSCISGLITLTSPNSSIKAYVKYRRLLSVLPVLAGLLPFPLMFLFGDMTIITVLPSVLLLCVYNFVLDLLYIKLMKETSSLCKAVSDKLHKSAGIPEMNLKEDVSYA